jgi:hypothetical protein
MTAAPVPVSFRATILLAGKSATGIEVPDDVVAALGSSRRTARRVCSNPRLRDSLRG